MLCQKIPQNKDDFDNFLKWHLIFKSRKTGRTYGI